uniref:Dolichol-phosphate mannosyltransferase subunit 3 n=1 Tax=Oncorhynchus mykiss TaxID=8022 RepID=A0A8C7U9Z8_ONCMY
NDKMLIPEDSHHPGLHDQAPGVGVRHLGTRLPEAYREVAGPMPEYLLVVFGCYKVATFNDCEEASKELKAQIKEM